MGAELKLPTITILITVFRGRSCTRPSGKASRHAILPEGDHDCIVVLHSGPVRTTSQGSIGNQESGCGLAGTSHDTAMSQQTLPSTQLYRVWSHRQMVHGSWHAGCNEPIKLLQSPQGQAKHFARALDR